MDIGDRIKHIRKHYGMTQQELADSLKLKQNTVATYEMGRTRPSDRTIIDICEKFNVNISWLADGVGEPFIEITRDDEIMDFMNRILKGSSSFKGRLISALAQLNEDEWELLEKMANKLLREEQKNADQ